MTAANTQPDASKDFQREYPSRPIVAVGAVVIHAGCLLLATKPSYGAWSLPGGAVQLGETLHAAAQREILEECGITIRPTELIGYVDRIVPDTQGRIFHHYTILDFLAEYISGRLRPGSDIVEARWIPFAEISAYPLTPMLPGLLNKVFAMRRIPLTLPGGEPAPLR
ncbi:MAG: NUDIX hydrolase [Candidatus Tectomicrobia bacterium]|nr:NUDIX hydrolase [Candidatus Tectomicrobia bacterium]